MQQCWLHLDRDEGEHQVCQSAVSGSCFVLFVGSKLCALETRPLNCSLHVSSQGSAGCSENGHLEECTEQEGRRGVTTIVGLNEDLELHVYVAFGLSSGKQKTETTSSGQVFCLLAGHGNLGRGARDQEERNRKSKRHARGWCHVSNYSNRWASCPGII